MNIDSPWKPSAFIEKECAKCGALFETHNLVQRTLCEKHFYEWFNNRQSLKGVVDVPLKGSERYYKERWFRKDQKTWEADIKSRRSVTPEGAVVHRVNEAGERIG